MGFFRLFARKSRPGRRAELRFRPRVERLEVRWCPANVLDDWWQPAGVNNLWSNGANWSLGYAPVYNDVQGMTTYNDIAEFDNTHTGNGHTGNANCVDDVGGTPFGIDFLHNWAKQFEIQSGEILDCHSYFDATGNANPAIVADSTGSQITIENNDIYSSTFDGGSLQSSKGNFLFLSSNNLELKNPYYTDWNMQFGDLTHTSGTVDVRASSSGAFQVGQNRDVNFLVYDDMILFGTGANKSLKNTGNTINTYIYVESTGKLETDGLGLAARIDIPIWNIGTASINGSLYMYGSWKANDMKDINGHYYHMYNTSGGTVDIGKFTTGASPPGIDFICSVSGGQAGFYQANAPSYTICDDTGGQDQMDTDGTYHANCLINFTGGKIALNGSAGITLKINDLVSATGGGAQFKCTNTSIYFKVSTDELTWSTISLDNGWTSTVDTTDTATVLGGNGGVGTGATFTFLNNISTGSDWTWGTWPSGGTWSDADTATTLAAKHS